MEQAKKEDGLNGSFQRYAEQCASLHGVKDCSVLSDLDQISRDEQGHAVATENLPIGPEEKPWNNDPMFVVLGPKPAEVCRGLAGREVIDQRPEIGEWTLRVSLNR